MAKVTSKLQVTVPKGIAERYGIRPGDEIDWVPAGDSIRVVRRGERAGPGDLALRVRLFDAATERQRLRQAGGKTVRSVRDRGWRRDELYDRARPR